MASYPQSSKTPNNKPSPKLKASNSKIHYRKLPDYRRTQKIFEEQGLMKFWDKKKPPELLDDELFEAKVINPNTKEYYQVSDLPVE
jgi:hypothetical protein